MFSCEYCETSKNTYFKEHLRTATSDFRKWLFKTFFLDSHFQNHLDLVILQKYQSLLNESFKYKSVHSPPLNLTPTLSFESSFCIFIINGHDTKSTCLLSLGSLSFNRSFTMENKTFLVIALGRFLNGCVVFLIESEDHWNIIWTNTVNILI